MVLLQTIIGNQGIDVRRNSGNILHSSKHPPNQSRNTVKTHITGSPLESQYSKKVSKNHNFTVGRTGEYGHGGRVESGHADSHRQSLKNFAQATHEGTSRLAQVPERPGYLFRLTTRLREVTIFQTKIGGSCRDSFKETAVATVRS